MKYELNAIYQIKHNRKGTFSIKVTSDNEDSVTGNIVLGSPKMLCADNEKELGDEITLGKFLISDSKKILQVVA